MRFPVARRVRRGACGLAVCLAAAAIASCSDNTVGLDSRSVTIGGLFSLTGNWSSLGVTSKAALELAVEDVNASLAGQGLRFRADIRDTRLDPTVALAEAQDLAHDGAQVIIGPQSSAELTVLKPWVDANHQVLVISQSSTAGSLALSGDNILRFTPSDSLEGVAVSALMWSDGIRAVVPTWRADAGNQGLHSATATRFAALGGSVSNGVEYATTTSSFSATVSGVGTQVRQALATHPAAQVGVYLAGFDEVAELLKAAAADPVLASVRWYGSDGVALSSALLVPGTTSFAQTVGYPNPVFGLDDNTQSTWGPIAERIRARAGSQPDAFALAVYDAVWVAAQAYLSAGRPTTIDALRTRFIASAGSYFGATGWTVLNGAGDRSVADFDFWAIRAGAWTRVAQYDTRAGTLTRH